MMGDILRCGDGPRRVFAHRRPRLGPDRAHRDPQRPGDLETFRPYGASRPGPAHPGDLGRLGVPRAAAARPSGTAAPSLEGNGIRAGRSDQPLQHLDKRFERTGSAAPRMDGAHHRRLRRLRRLAERSRRGRRPNDRDGACAGRDPDCRDRPRGPGLRGRRDPPPYPRLSPARSRTPNRARCGSGTPQIALHWGPRQRPLHPPDPGRRPSGVVESDLHPGRRVVTMK